MARDSSSRLQAAAEAKSTTDSASIVATPIAASSDSISTKGRDKEPYEFSAPQYYDFAKPSPGVGQSDAWFERPHSSMTTPASTAKGDKTPHRKKGHTDSSSAPAPPPTVTQTRRRLSENDRPSNFNDTQLISAIVDSIEVAAAPSPQVITAPKRNSLNVFDDAERQREKSPSTSSTRHATYESLFDMTSKRKSTLPSKEAALHKPAESYRSKEDLIKAVSPKLGKVRTPDRVKLERLKTAAPLLPTRSTKPLTVPVEFKFTERKPRSSAIISDATTEVKTFPKSQVNQIIKQTKRLTIPESPQLMTRQRVHKTYPFAAPTEHVEEVSDWHTTPLDKDSTAAPIIPCVTTIRSDKPRLTVPVSFNLTTSSRRRPSEDGPGIKDKACVTTTGATLPTMKKVPVKKPLTIPESPNIMKPGNKKTAMLGGGDLLEGTTSFKAHPVPSYAHPFKPVVEHKHSEAHSPHLPGNVIAEGKRRRFQEALQRERQLTEEARQFHARPMPDFDHFEQHAMQQQAKPLTKPEPFNLQSELRHQQYQEQLHQKLAKEDAELARQREFHSRPVPHTGPFQPKKSTKPLTAVEPIKLHSAERALKRRQFDEQMRARELETAERERHLIGERRKREAEEIKTLRQQLVPKARPVMHYAPVVVKASERKLTVPVSPALLTKKRAISINARSSLHQNN